MKNEEDPLYALGLSLPESYVKWLTTYAKARGYPRSYITRLAIYEFIVKHDEDPLPEPLTKPHYKRAERYFDPGTEPELVIPAKRLPEGMLDCRNLRKKLNMSQNRFSDHFDISLKTVQSWEQGYTHPNRTSTALLRALILLHSN